MSALSFFGYAIMVAIAPAIVVVATRWFRRVVSVVKALRVLSRERRIGETLYDCAEAIAGDAHNWRGMVEASESPNFDNELRAEQATETSWEVDADGRLIPGTVKKYVVPQPPPVNASGPALWPLIISELGDSETDKLLATDMQARHEFGIAKYGVPLVASNGRDHLADAYQEALDFVVYLRAAFDENADLCHKHKKTIASGAIATDLLAYKAYARGSKVHALYIDAIDMARDVRELIRERDGK